MKTNSSVKLGLACAVAAAVLSAPAVAKTATANMTVTVKNAFQLQKDLDMNFGEIRAVHDETVAECAGVFLSPDPAVTTIRALDSTNDKPAGGSAATFCATADTAKMTALGGTIQPAAFTVSDAADFTDMTMSLPAKTTIENPNPTGVDLAYVYPTAFRTTGTQGEIVLTCDATSCTAAVQTDDTGGFSFNLGGGLITEPAAFVGAYGEGPTAFTGSVTVTVEYK